MPNYFANVFHSSYTSLYFCMNLVPSTYTLIVLAFILHVLTHGSIFSTGNRFHLQMPHMFSKCFHICSTTNIFQVHIVLPTDPHIFPECIPFYLKYLNMFQSQSVLSITPYSVGRNVSSFLYLLSHSFFMNFSLISFYSLLILGRNKSS